MRLEYLKMELAVHRKGFLGVSKSLWHDPRTWLLLLAVTERSIFRYMMLVVSMATGIEGIGVAIMHIAYVVLIAKCMKRGSHFRDIDIIILLFVVFAIITTLVISPDNIVKYMFGRGQFWPTVFPLFRFFIVGLFLIPSKETVDLIGKVSCLAVLAETMFVLLILRGSEMQSTDDMSRAYFILLNVLLTINYAYDRRTTFGILFAIVGSLLLLSMGSRGPIMILLAFFAAKVYQTSTKKGRGAVVIVVALLLMAFVNSSLFDDFILLLRDILRTLGMSTRIVDFAIEHETLTYLSERDEIFAVVWNKILENPMGYGVYGEWQFVGWFAHNVYLEILAGYGVILGGAILFWLLFITIKTFFATKYAPIRSLVLLFACEFFVRGFFGGSFLSFETFLLIGFCMQIFHKSNFKYLTA